MYYFSNTYQSPLNSVIQNPTSHMGMHYASTNVTNPNSYFAYHLNHNHNHSHNIRPLMPYVQTSNQNNENMYANTNHRCLPQSMMNLTNFPLEQPQPQQQQQMGFFQKTLNFKNSKDNNKKQHKTGLDKGSPAFDDHLMENTMRKTKQVYNMDLYNQVKYPHFNAIQPPNNTYVTNVNQCEVTTSPNGHTELERKDSGEYFVASGAVEYKNEKLRNERKLLKKHHSQSEQDSKSESFVNTGSVPRKSGEHHHHVSKFEKLSDRGSSKFKVQKDLVKLKQQTASISFRKSRSQQKVAKKPSFRNKTTKSESIRETSDSESLVTTATDDADIKKSKESAMMPAQTQTQPPPAPPMSNDLFKQSDSSMFDRLKKVKKPAIPRGADEKTSKSFDAVVNELKTKLNKIKKEDTDVPIKPKTDVEMTQAHVPTLIKTNELKLNHKSSFYKPTSKDIEVIKNVLTKVDMSKANISKQIMKNKEMALAASFKSNSSIFSNKDVTGKSCFKPVVNEPLTKTAVNHESFKYAKVSVLAHFLRARVNITYLKGVK